MNAAVEYRRLDPVAVWLLPASLRLTAWTLRLRAAVALAILPDVAALIELLTPRRGVHAGGGLSCDGPVELAIATGAAALGDLDGAVGGLQAALVWSRAHGARPFLVETMVELASALTRRAGPGDIQHAQTLLDEADMTATELGMTPFAARVQRLRRGVRHDRSDRSQLTARETQVAHLVALGLTNRQIADTLVVTERTAENHVQHILDQAGGSATALRSPRGSPRARRTRLSSELSTAADACRPAGAYGRQARGGDQDRKAAAMSYAMVSQNHGVDLGWHHTLERELGDDPIDGLIATYAGTGRDGMCVISVWESKAHADRFTAELLVPTPAAPRRHPRTSRLAVESWRLSWTTP